MKVIIIEDEARAANHIERLLKKIAPDIEVVAKIETVRQSIEYLNHQPHPNLIFSDVQLADGLSFEIYDKVSVKCPIIFTTAYDQYAIEAFNTNGIDYLLKPVEEERLQKALQKSRQFSGAQNLNSLLSLIQMPAVNHYKARFLVKIGDKIKPIIIDEIVAFYSLEKATYIYTQTKRSYPIDYSLDQLTVYLNPDQFFRINRKFWVSIGACNSIIAYSNSRLKINIDGLTCDDIVVAREKVQEFKQWLDR